MEIESTDIIRSKSLEELTYTQIVKANPENSLHNRATTIETSKPFQCIELKNNDAKQEQNFPLNTQAKSDLKMDLEQTDIQNLKLWPEPNSPTASIQENLRTKPNIETLMIKIQNLETHLSKRESHLKKEVADLQSQLASVTNERDMLKSQIALNPTPAKANLEKLLNTDMARLFHIDNDAVGVVLKLEHLMRPIKALRDNLTASGKNKTQPSFVMGLSEEGCEDFNHQNIESLLLSRTSEILISNLNKDMHNPGVNMAGLIIETIEMTNVTRLLKTNPSNAIWVNCGDSPLLVKISSEAGCKTMILNPGYGIAIGKRKIHHEVFIWTPSANLEDLFHAHQKQRQACALCFTMGNMDHDSWLNALNVERSGWSQISSSEDKPLSENRRPSIRDRLESLGIPTRKKPTIRIAPVMNSGLGTNFLESQVTYVEEWVANMVRSAPNIVLPEVEKVVPFWETSRNGNRFRILRILFKSEQGLATMCDLLHGSKVNLLEGLPTELEKVRDKIYVSLLNPHRRRAHMAC